MLNLLKPVKVILNPPTRLEGLPGETVTLHVSLINQGNQSAVFEVLLDSTDPAPTQWCQATQQRVALDPQQGCEVSLPFELPVHARPGTYAYIIAVDAPSHYPEDTPIYYSGQLDVLVREQPVESLEVPKFTIEPNNTPEHPLEIQPGQPLQLSVQVQNRSNRVDRFRLQCLELSEAWFSVDYQSVDLNGPGLLAGQDGLELNPGTQGEILAVFHYPSNLPAGQYAPTLQLLSDNAPEQINLDVVYLEAKPKLNLAVELETLLGKISQGDGQYRLKLTNHSNMMRSLAVSAQSRDETQRCDYRCEPAAVDLLIGESAEIDLVVTPKPKWRRPLFGRGAELPFQINLEDQQALPIPETLPTGLLIWKARSWWQLLLIFLAGLGTISGLGFLIWLVFFKPAPPPTLIEFQPDSRRYIEGGKVRLNWEIDNVNQLEQIIITSRRDKTNNPPQIYDFRQGLPEELGHFCQIQAQYLTCNNVDTGARLAGKYHFQFNIEAKAKQHSSQQEIAVTIEPKPLPKIVNFSSTQNRAEKDKPILLSWELDNLSQLSQLQIIGQRQDEQPIVLKTYDFQKKIPPELDQACQSQANAKLNCANVTIQPPSQPGLYALNLKAISADAQKTAPLSEPVQMQVEAELPIIKAFTLNGKSATQTPSFFLKPGETVNLRWQVEGDDVKVKVAPLGDVAAVASRTLQATQGLSQITLIAENAQGQSVQQSFLIQVNVPGPNSPGLGRHVAPNDPRPAEPRLPPSN